MSDSIAESYVNGLMGESAYDSITNRSGRAATIYSRPTAGPRVLPDHVRLAQKRQHMIDVSSGEVMYQDIEDRLRREAANAATQKRRASHSAVNAAIATSPGTDGPLGGGVVTRGPEPYLLRVFGIQR